MAKTLIGQLILKLRAEGLQEGNKVLGVMNDIERKAKTIGQTGIGSWGIGFQRQLDKLKLASNDIGDVERSWIQLHNSMKSRNLAQTMRSAEVSHWRTNTLSHLAKQRADIEDHFKQVELSAGRHGHRMAGIMRAAFVAGGFYTAAYGGGMAIREGLTASSERRREIFRQQMAGIPDKERDKLFNASETAAAKYPSVPVTAVMELSRSGFTVMGDAERAAAVLDRMVESLVVLQSARGPEAAAHQLINLIRGLDSG